MQRFINFWQTALSATLPAGAEQMTVPAAAAELLSFSEGAWYKATVTNSARSAWEIVRVTARAGGVLSIARAQEGTAAVEWPAGSAVFIELTAEAINSVFQQLVDLTTRLEALEAGSPGGDSVRLVDGLGNVLVDQAGNTLIVGE